MATLDEILAGLPEDRQATIARRATELQFFTLCWTVWLAGITLACERADAWLAGVEGKGRS